MKREEKVTYLIHRGDLYDDKEFVDSRMETLFYTHQIKEEPWVDKEFANAVFLWEKEISKIGDLYIQLEKRKPEGRCTQCNKIYFEVSWKSFRNADFCSKECKKEWRKIHEIFCAWCELQCIKHMSQTGKYTYITLCDACKCIYPLLRERKRVQTNLHRAQENDSEATLTLHEWMTILDAFGLKCAYCGDVYELIEHIIPVSKDGGTTKENCVPACKSCNAKKSNKLIHLQPELMPTNNRHPLLSKRLDKINEVP